MSQVSEKLGMIVGGVITILISLIALVNNLFFDEVAFWTTVALLGVGALVFLWAFMIDRKAWQLVGAYVMAIIATFIWVVTRFELPDYLVPTIVLSVIAFPFLVAWLFNRQLWGMLIPAYIMFAIIPILYITEKWDNPENWLTVYTLIAVALPFFVTYFATHRWGWLVPAFALLLVAGMFIIVQAGFPEQLITIGLPVLALLVGVGLLARVWLGQPTKRID